MISTNYNSVLENLRDRWMENTVTLRDEQLPKTFVVKLYGKLKSPETLIFSRDELRALLHTIGYAVTAEQLARTVDYHLERTSHGSTLSGVVSAWVLARYHPEEAWRFLQTALDSDVSDVQGGTTAEGIHLASCGAVWQAVVFGFAGLQLSEEDHTTHPIWPDGWTRIAFKFFHKGELVSVDLHKSQEQG